MEAEISPRELSLMRNSETCLLSVCRVAAEQSTVVCRHGCGLVKHLDEMDPEDWEWAMGLYEVLLETMAWYCNCEEKRQNGICVLMNQDEGKGKWMERTEIIDELARFISRVGDSTLVVTADEITLRVRCWDGKRSETAQSACNEAFPGKDFA